MAKHFIGYLPTDATPDEIEETVSKILDAVKEPEKAKKSIKNSI